MPETTTTTVKTGYMKTWQGILKLLKIICLLACLIASALMVDRTNGWVEALDYCLAVAVIGFLLELVIWILYLAGINRKWSSTSTCAIIFLVYHVIMFVLVFAAIIVMTRFGDYWNYHWRFNNGRGYAVNTVDESTPMAYNAFASLALAFFWHEIYLNVVWMKGGPELMAVK